jgi:hypothetical protein
MFFLIAPLLCFLLGFLFSNIKDNLSSGLTIFQTIKRFMRWIVDRKGLYWIEHETEPILAMYLHCDIGIKIVELLENPCTMESDWREILPLCKYSDEWFAKTHPYIKNFSRKEDFVRDLMA